MTSRSWNDHQTKASLTKGKWTEKEVNHLKRLLCKYASRKGLTAEQLASLCSDTTPAEYKNVWTKLAKYFPNRSVQSVHNCCKRNFNPFNYKGEWSVKEERTLIEFIKTNGKKWKELGDLLQRTALNVKDKYKQMGGDNHALRKTGVWNISETVELVKLVFMNLEIDWEEIDEKNRESDAKILDTLLKLIETHKKTLKKHEINWEAISEVFQTRSSVDCRTRWNYLFNYKVPERMSFTKEDDIEIFKAIRNQNAFKIENIDFSKVKNQKNPEDNRFRFKVLAKAMSGRLNLSLSEILDKLEFSYDVEKATTIEEPSIIEYYTAKYNPHSDH